MHRELATPAFVLHARAYGESDRIVTLLTEQHGKLSGIAKGAKNSRKRFGGTLEPFVRIRAVFRQRSASDLVFLLRCEHLATLGSFTRDLDRFAAGTYALELTDRMVHGRESGREVYALLDQALGLLNTAAPIDPALRAFELHLLAVTGYQPVFERCRSCGAGATDLGVLYLALERGGVVCRRCVRAGEPVRPIAAATALALARLAVGPLDVAATGVAAGLLPEVATVVEHLLGGATSGPLRSREFLQRSRVDSPPPVR